MFSILFKYFICIYFSYYAYSQILLLHLPSKKFPFSYIAFSCVITLLVIPLLPYHALIRLLSIIMISFLSITHITNTHFKISFATTFLCFGINFVIYTLSCTFLSIIVMFIYKTAHEVPYSLINIFVGILHSFLIVKLFNIEQLRSGLFTLIKNKHSYSGVLITICFILITSYVTNIKHSTNFTTRISFIFIILIFSILLLYWWRYRIKQTYIENMRRLETISYENAIMDRDKQIKELRQDNAEFGQIIHKYRKVIPAMELSVTELLQSSSTLAPEELNNRALALRTQLEELRSERNNLLDKYQKDTIVMAQSGLHTVDAMIALMEKRAKQEGIRYRTQIDPTLKELALNSVKESDLLHLLGDMVENAIHAVSLTEDKKILIHLGKLNDCLLLEISDSGIAFDIQTYQHFGNEPFTSHQSDGGSGTGLMDIWKLKKEYKASLYIYEYSSEHEVYTKKISLLFDRKNHFLLKTYRDKEIKNSLIRGDLHVFPHQTD